MKDSAKLAVPACVPTLKIVAKANLLPKVQTEFLKRFRNILLCNKLNVACAQIRGKVLKEHCYGDFAVCSPKLLN